MSLFLDRTISLFKESQICPRSEGTRVELLYNESKINNDPQTYTGSKAFCPSHCLRQAITIHLEMLDKEDNA